MELYAKSCGACIHRVLDDGGKQDCPLLDASRRAYEAQATHDCPRFKLGDAQLRPAQIRDALADATESLF